MTPLAKQIFSGATNPASVDSTEIFTQCDYLLFNPLNLGGDALEIAATISIETIAEVEYLGGNLTQPGVNLGVKEILLPIDFFDTSTIITVPQEATLPQANCRVCLSTSYSVNLEIYAVYHNQCLCVQELEELLNEVKFNNALTTGIAINQIAQDLVLLGTANLLGAVLLPVTGGASAALPAAANTALPAGTTAILPALIGAGITLPF